MENFEERNYVIFNVSELDKINFNEVLETSSETVRKTIDETKTFVKWDGDTPNCIQYLTTKEGFYTYDEMSIILETPEWVRIDVL